jgi:hypothetical protein
MSEPEFTADTWDEIFDFDRYRNATHDLTKPIPAPPLIQEPPSLSPSPYSDPQNPFHAAADSFIPRVNYIANPVAWGKDVLGEFYYEAQRTVLHSVRDFRYTAVQSCHDSGKSFIAAREAVLWITEHPAGEAFVVSTAPTAAQVSAILWREIQRAFGKSAFMGNITTAGYPQWKINGELVGYGRKPADYSQSAFQGIHARFVLVIVDEACGVDQHLFNSVDALVTNANARVLAIGNPDDATTHFAQICKPDSGWNVIRIDGLRTPNFTRDLVWNVDCHQCRQQNRSRPLLVDLMEEEGIPFSEEEVPEDIRDLLLSPLWVEERLHRWVGQPTEAQTLSELANKSALWLSKVRGLFPTSASEGVCPLGWVELAMSRWQDWADAGKPPLPVNERHVLGVDVADTGEDESCISFREGVITYELRKFRSDDIMETTGKIKGAMTGRRGSLAIIDGIGIGAGVVSRLREQKMPVRAFIASHSASGLKDKNGELGFLNLRAAAWWRMRELLDPSQPGGAHVMLPPREMLKADLTTPHWKVLSGGKIQIESKDDIRKRLGRSTDEGDAVVMSYWSGRGTIDSDDTGVISWWDKSSDEPNDAVASWDIEEAANQWSQVL